MFLGFTIGTELYIICNKFSGGSWGVPNHSRWQNERLVIPKSSNFRNEKRETPLMLMEVPLDPNGPHGKMKVLNPQYIW